MKKLDLKNLPSSLLELTEKASETGHNKSFTYSRIKKAAYRGYKFEKIEGMTALIALPEKALADYLYFVDLKLKSMNERLDLRKIKKKELLKYAKLYGRKSLIKLIKEI